MNNILLSIIIPVYNTEKELLIECLNSIKKELNTKVISQERIEIIIVNAWIKQYLYFRFFRKFGEY